ncbi:glycosyl transferase family 2 [cyanobiont of Ornithocercus magnificus]|nr:glycosyl transferase family 2 [cyanobiont of Ornithocercus magnificus]
MNKMNKKTVEGAPIDEAEALRRLEQRDDPASRYYAAWWLGHERSKHVRTLPLLRAALQELLNSGNNPSEECRALALNVLRALVHLNGAEARTELLACLEYQDSDIREEAARTIGAAGLREAIPAICQQLRYTAKTGEHLLEALLEALGDLGQADSEVIQALESFASDERPLIRSASCRALLQLTGQSQWAEAFAQLLQHSSSQVCRGVLIDLGVSGWVPCLRLIQDSPVENSIKLIALRGLAEHPRGLQAAGLEHNEAVQAVINAMDELL